MTCRLCEKPITDDQPSRDLPELAGGGKVHESCYSQLEPYIKRLEEDYRNGVSREASEEAA